MCDTCEGQIILRTADGFEQTVKVKDCDLDSYFTAVVDRHRIYAATYADLGVLPETVGFTTRREYRWRHETRDGVRILDEVAPKPETTPSRRFVEALDSMVFEEVEQ